MDTCSELDGGVCIVATEKVLVAEVAAVHESQDYAAVWHGFGSTEQDVGCCCLSGVYFCFGRK